MNFTSRELAGQLAKTDGIAGFIVLVNDDNEIVPAKVVNGKYGPVWLLFDGDMADLYDRKFIPMDESHINDPRFANRSKVQEKFGLRQAWELAESRVISHGSNPSWTSEPAIVRVDWKDVDYGGKFGHTWFEMKDEFI